MAEFVEQHRLELLVGEGFQEGRREQQNGSADAKDRHPGRRGGQEVHLRQSGKPGQFHSLGQHPLQTGMPPEVQGPVTVQPVPGLQIQHATPQQYRHRPEREQEQQPPAHGKPGETVLKPGGTGVLEVAAGGQEPLGGPCGQAEPCQIGQGREHQGKAAGHQGAEEGDLPALAPVPKDPAGQQGRGAHRNPHENQRQDHAESLP